MLGHAEISRVVQDLIDPAQQPNHQRLNQVGVLFVVHALEVKALHAGQRQRVLNVVKDGVIDALTHPLGQVTVELLGQEEVGKPTVLDVKQVHV